MFPIYLKAITKQHIKVLNKLQSVEDLTLVGGTALALQIGHRKSYDLDFITQSKFISRNQRCYKKISRCTEMDS